MFRAVHGYYYVPRLRLRTAVIGGVVAGVALGAGYSLLFAGNPQDPSMQEFMLSEGVIGAIVGATIYVLVDFSERFREQYKV